MSEHSKSVQPVIVSIQSQLVCGCAGNNAVVPRLQKLGPTGAGDLLAAAFLLDWLLTREVSIALQESVANVFSIMQQAADMNLHELEPAQTSLPAIPKNTSEQ